MGGVGLLLQGTRGVRGAVCTPAAVRLGFVSGQVGYGCEQGRAHEPFPNPIRTGLGQARTPEHSEGPPTRAEGQLAIQHGRHGPELKMRCYHCYFSVS